MRKIRLELQDKEFLIQAYTQLNYSYHRESYEEYLQAFRDYHDLFTEIKKKYGIEEDKTVYKTDWAGGFIEVEDNSYGNI